MEAIVQTFSQYNGKSTTIFCYCCSCYDTLLFFIFSNFNINTSQKGYNYINMGLDENQHTIYTKTLARNIFSLGLAVFVVVMVQGELLKNK